MAEVPDELQNCTRKGQRLPQPLQGPQILRFVHPGAAGPQMAAAGATRHRYAGGDALIRSGVWPMLHLQRNEAGHLCQWHPRGRCPLDAACHAHLNDWRPPGPSEADQFLKTATAHQLARMRAGDTSAISALAAWFVAIPVR